MGQIKPLWCIKIQRARGQILRITYWNYVLTHFFSFAYYIHEKIDYVL